MSVALGLALGIAMMDMSAQHGIDRWDRWTRFRHRRIGTGVWCCLKYLHGIFLLFRVFWRDRSDYMEMGAFYGFFFAW